MPRWTAGRLPTSSSQRCRLRQLRDLVGHHPRERPPRGLDPRIGRDVGDRVVAGEVRRVPSSAWFEHADDAQRLADEALDRVRDLLGRLVHEVAGLADDRPDVAHLVHEPLHHVGARAHVGAAGSGPRLLGEVDEDRARLEERERAAGDVVIDDRRESSGSD